MSYQPPAAINGTNERGASAVGSYSIVSVHHASRIMEDLGCLLVLGQKAKMAASVESSQECRENGKSNEESDGLGDSAWKSGHIKGSKWEDSEDEHRRMWVTQDARPRWKAIYRRFPKRTDASVCLRGHKIRSEETAKRRTKGD